MSKVTEVHIFQVRDLKQVRRKESSARLLKKT